jgi:hypothetical protein
VAPVDAAITATARLPDDFPKVGAAPVNGKLVDKRFELKKAMLRTRQDGTELTLYAWSEGDPCEPQFAPESDQLYASVSFPTPRFVPGEILRSSEERVIVMYKKPDFKPVDEASWTIFDEIGADRVKGRLLLTGPDGTRIGGSFDAALCTSAMSIPKRSRSSP